MRGKKTSVLTLAAVFALWFSQPGKAWTGQGKVSGTASSYEMALPLVLDAGGNQITAAASNRNSSSAEGMLTPAEPDEATRERASEAYGKLPLQFEANLGQTDEEVEFLSRGSGYTLFLTSAEAVLALRKPQGEEAPGEDGSPAKKPEGPQAPSGKVDATVLRMRLVGSNSSLEAVGLDELPGKANYLIGNDPEKWHTNVPTYGKVRYREVYPGIDLVYYGKRRQLEYDFVVSAGTDPETIRLAFEGADEISLDDEGNLILHTKGGEVVLQAPILYQQVEGSRQEISGSYVLEGDSQVAFQVAAYDHERSLVIDPVLAYSTYLGGSNIDRGWGIAVDSSGSAYVTGETYSVDFPTANPIQGAFAGVQDAFVTKLNAAGSALVYSTYLGGSGGDFGYGIAVDSSGSAYVTGETYSVDFPTANPIQGAFAGAQDAFVTKLNAAGSALVYSTYLGGSSYDRGYGIAVDSSGSAHVTGYTRSSNFPTASPIQGAFAGNYDTFVTKLNAAGSALVYSTYLGGGGTDYGYGIAIDSSGGAYVTGYTDSVNFPTASALQSTNAGTNDAFVTKLNAAGSALVYSTYLGGSNADVGQGVAVDSSGNTYVTGRTMSADFPTASALQSTNAGTNDAFVTKLNAAGSALVYSTYLGGSSHDYGYGIAVDSSGSACVTGETGSADFPTASALQSTNAGTNDAFVTKLNAAGSALVYSTYLGGSSADVSQGIAVDSSGGAYVTGRTQSVDFPTASPIQGANAGISDAFVTKISIGTSIPVVTCMEPSGFPVCNGSCLEGEACVNTGAECVCKNKNKACESAAGPTCDGDCPLDHACQVFSTGCQCALVPTLSQWGIILMLFVMFGGVLFLRRRQRVGSPQD